MSTPFLRGFASLLLRRLADDGLVELRPEDHDAAALGLADALAGAQGESLLSAVTAGLLAVPEITELYADDEDLKAAIEALRP